MKSQVDSIKTKVLTVAAAVVLAVSIIGCNDPIVSEMDAEHRQMSGMVMQELQQCPSALPAGSNTEVLFRSQ